MSRPVHATLVSGLLFVGGCGLLSLALPLSGDGSRELGEVDRRIGRHPAYEQLWDLSLSAFGVGGTRRETAGMAVLLVLAGVMLTAAIALFLRRRLGQRLALAVIGGAVLCELFAGISEFLGGELEDALSHLARTLALLCVFLAAVGPRTSAWLAPESPDERTFA